MPLDLFKVPEAEAVRMSEDALRGMTEAMFLKQGLSRADAALAADVLVAADLRGVDSHGVSNMLRNYVAAYQAGRYNPTPQWKVIRERASTATIDADRGIGIVVAPKAMELAIAKAKQTGMGVVTINNAGHMGMASYHAMMALEHDMIGMAMTAVGVQVLPTFGAEPRLGTNPIAVAVPANRQHPFVFDVATSVVAGNKITLGKRLGVTFPAGMVADAAGTPVPQTGPLPDNYKLVPFGGTRELGSHKGYGLAMVVEIMCTLLSGAVPNSLDPVNRPAAHYVAAYDIDAFTDVAEFKDMMDRWLTYLEATPPAPGHERVLTPGLEEVEAEAQRRELGIPLHTEVIEWFQTACAELDIPFRLR